MPAYTKDQIARAFIAEGKRRGITTRGRVICIATGLVESNLVVYANAKVPESMELPHDAVGADSLSVGALQQQVRKGATGQWWWGDAKTCMDPTSSAGLFYDRLAKLDYNNPANTPGSYAQAIQQSAFPARYDNRMGDAQQIHDRLEASVPVVPDNRPDFNEIDQIGWDHEDPHGSIRSRPPINWFLHTQEANSNATDLAAWMRSTTGNSAVSYHYTVHEDPNDHGVTVVDVIDTDLYSWSVLDANVFSINGCFAGSFAGWTREQWLSKFGRAIDVMAYLAVQDCKKYPTMSANVILPPYAIKGPGISDHKYVTQALGIGSHTDVGNGFPWDVFTAAVHKYVAGDVKPPEVPNQPPPKQLTDRQLLQENWDQLRGIDGKGWPQLGGQTLVNALGEVRDKVCGTTDYHNWKAGK